jgi:uncharacterized protein (DUF362 family)
VEKKAKVAIAKRPHVPGAPDYYGPKELAVVREMLEEVLGNLGGLGACLPKKSGTVVVKPNAGFASLPGVHKTDPRVLEALIGLVFEEICPARVIVLESAADHHMLHDTGLGKTSRECFEANGILKAAERAGAEVLSLDGEPFERVPITKGFHYQSVLLPKVLLEADACIYVPKMKTHAATFVTLGIKLAQGLLPPSEQGRFHRADLAQKLVDILHAIRPSLTVVDGIWAEQGRGPTSPFEDDIIKDMNALIAGTDVVAVDTVAGYFMGFDPHEVETTFLAHTQGHGSGVLEGIEVIGGELEVLKRPFRRADRRMAGFYPNVRFYLGGACEGCLSHLRLYLDPLLASGVLSEMEGPVNVLVGYKLELPERLEGPSLVVGDCTAEHKHLGLFIEGCCPLGKIFKGLLEVIAQRMPDQT